MSRIWSRRCPSIATILAACIMVSSPASAQHDTVPALQPQAWSTEGREPVWRTRVDASDGFILSKASLLHRPGDGAILLIVERKPGEEEIGTPRNAVVERRDAAGRTVWHQKLPGLPSRYWGPGVLAAKGPAGAHLTLVSTFGPDNPARNAVHGSIIALDEPTGAMRVTGVLRRPGTGPYVAEDGLGVDLAIMSSTGLILLAGGVGQGPFTWWVGLRRPDGAVLWDIVSQHAVGEVRDIRRFKDGFEISVLNLLSDNGTTGPFILRIGGAGRVTSSARFRNAIRAPVFTPGGGLAWLQDREPATLIVEDRRGNRRFAASVAGVYNIMPCLEDGTLVLTREQDKVLVAPDGKTSIATTAEVQPDGSLLVSRCEAEQDCRTMTLSLFARPR